MVKLLAVGLLVTVTTGCKETEKVTDQQTNDNLSTFVSVEDLRGAPILSGASTTYWVPRISKAGTQFVQGMHGIIGPRDGATAKLETPSVLWVFDARTGMFVGEERIEGEVASFPAAEIDVGALQRVGTVQRRLVPFFFLGKPLPVEHQAAAESYRRDFRTGTQPNHWPFYQRVAGPWFRWVGLLD